VPGGMHGNDVRVCRSLLLDAQSQLKSAILHVTTGRCQAGWQYSRLQTPRFTIDGSELPAEFKE
jgi:hypothetical protein